MNLKRNFYTWWQLMVISITLFSCAAISSNETKPALAYCLEKVRISVRQNPSTQQLPRSIFNGETKWRTVDYRDWTSGFWPGILWYAYEYSGDTILKNKAELYSKSLLPLLDSTAIDHDLGFQLNCSFANGYRLTDNPLFKSVLLRAADSLCKLYNPKVGTILSWPRSVPGMDYPARHNTIMDNMINLELLFRASELSGNSYYNTIAVNHATTTMQNHFREDYTSYHVVLYDTATGKKIRGLTHQGYNDNSMWARGQAWAIYGFSMVYRETKDNRFLSFAEKVTDVYLNHLPDDLIPYWDFYDPAIPDAPRDASAACIVASALLELSTFLPDKSKAETYKQKARSMLNELSSERYQSRGKNIAFLLHSTGHKPNGTEVDASIIYADYYYLEALMRNKRLQEGKNQHH